MLKWLPPSLIMLLLLCSCVQSNTETTPLPSVNISSPQTPTSSPTRNSNNSELSNGELLATAKTFILQAWNCAEQLQKNTTQLDPSEPVEPQLSDSCRWEDYERKLASYYSPDLYRYVMDNFNVFEMDGKCGYFKPNTGERYLLNPDGVFELISHTDTQVVIKAPCHYSGVDRIRTANMSAYEEMQQVSTDAIYTLKKSGGDWKIINIHQLFNDIVYSFKWEGYKLHIMKNAPLGTLYETVPYMSFYAWSDQTGGRLTLGLHSEDAGFTSITLRDPKESKTLIYAGLDTDALENFHVFYFTFQDDGYGNCGSGTISFLNSKGEDADQNDTSILVKGNLKVTINITQRNSAEGIFEGEREFRYIEDIFDIEKREGQGGLGGGQRGQEVHSSSRPESIATQQVEGPLFTKTAGDRSPCGLLLF